MNSGCLNLPDVSRLACGCHGKCSTELETGFNVYVINKRQLYQPIISQNMLQQPMEIQEKWADELKGGSILQSLYETVTILYGKIAPSLPPSGIFIYLDIDIWSTKL